MGILMLLAVFLFYDVNVGSRHLIPFIICGILALGMQEGISKLTVAAMLCMAWLFGVEGTDAYTYSLPSATDGMEAEVAYGEALLRERITIDTQGDKWDNTVIWLLADETGVTWQDLYAFPAGIGINLCTRDYVLANYGQLGPKYLLTNSRGEAVDAMCAQNGAELLAEYGQTHVWKLRE